MSSIDSEDLAKRYRIERQVGEGGMGIVYEAFDTVLEKKVALKVLSRKVTQRLSMRFQKEARAMGMLKHSNIVTVMDFGITSDQQPYMVLEFLVGFALSELIEKNGALPVAEATEIFRQLCSGLGHAHARGLIHRDIKPSNVFLATIEGQQVVKLLDFGIAKTEESDQQFTTSGAVVGSPLYMAPEHARAEMIDRRADIYALGCLMYEVLSGKPPIKGATAFETMTLVQDEVPEPISIVSPFEIPSWLNETVMKCLEKKKEDRVQTVEELSRLLEVDHEDVQVHAPLDISNDVRERKRRSLVIVVPMVAFLVLSALGIFSYLNWLKVSGSKDSDKKRQVESEDRAKLQFAELPKSAKNTKLEPPTEKMLDLEGPQLMINNATDEDLQVCRLPEYANVDRIMIDSPLITGKGFQYLDRLDLKYHLALRDCKLTDSNLRYLSNQNSLIKIKFEEMSKPDEWGLDFFARMPRLDEVVFANCVVNKSVFEAISKFKALKKIGFRGSSGVSREGLIYLSRIPRLTKLVLQRTDIDDSDVSVLHDMSIGEFDLSNNPKVTRKCLSTLASLKDVQRLSVQNCSVSEADLTQLARQLQLECDLAVMELKKKGISESRPHRSPTRMQGRGQAPVRAPGRVSPSP